MPKQRVLVVEDEGEIADLIRFHLEREGFEAAVIASGRLALDAVARRKPDLILLDLMLPDLDGLEVCRQLKWHEDHRTIPIVMVSAKGEEADVVTGIELGADDYVTKPFSPKVLMARVRSVLRRSTTRPAPDRLSPNRIEFAGGLLTIDPDRHVVRAANRAVELTVTEFGILQYLAARPGFVRTRDQIIAAVHGGNTVLSSRTIDVHVTALRRKLGDLGSMIETVRGVGYRLSEPQAANADD
ncbi:MAG: response regulator transcription factor [Phycisphaeraceae bacterium]|nr:response regulator transcription factor [Phycisphaeraceae bacterium]